jgi:GxxExxY protein
MTKVVDTDRSERDSAASRRTLVEEATTRSVIGAFFSVYNELGYGFLESVYRNALIRELRARAIATEVEVPIDVTYKGGVVGVFRADVLVERTVLLELKATQAIGPAEQRQLLNYLKATGIRVGLLLHFGPRARFYRVVC